jgi:hypothetical protein
VTLTHGNLADVVSRLNTVMHVTSEIREYVGGRLLGGYEGPRVRTA